MLDPTTYDLEQHDRLLVYLWEVRKLAPNTVYTAIKDLKSFLRWLRDERGVLVAGLTSAVCIVTSSYCGARPCRIRSW